MPDYPRAARWDTAEVLRQVRDATGIELADEGRAGGGEIGAAYVRWADGHRSVLTWGPQALATRQRARALLAIARAAGIPATDYELIAELPGGTAVIQRLLPGSPATAVTPRTVESMLEVNRRSRGLLAGRADLPAADLHLLTDGPGYCLHGPMASYDRATARLLAAIEEAGAARPERLDGGDLAHFDFHPENMLVDSGGVVTGVVDWDGASRSDGAIDLMTLRFDLELRASALAGPVAAELRERADPEVLLACWAHMSLRLVDWMIRERTAADVADWLAVAERLRPG